MDLAGGGSGTARSSKSVIWLSSKATATRPVTPTMMKAIRQSPVVTSPVPVQPSHTPANGAKPPSVSVRLSVKQFGLDCIKFPNDWDRQSHGKLSGSCDRQPNHFADAISDLVTHVAVDRQRKDAPRKTFADRK